MFSVWDLLCEKCRGCLLWHRDPFLEQVLGEEKVRWFESALRRAEMRWDEPTRSEISWGDVRRACRLRCERRREEMRRHKMSWQELRRAEKSWNELWQTEKSWDKPRWDEKRWEKLRRHEKRWEQLWSAEKSWERERRHEMGLDEIRWKKLRRHLMSWDELRWWDEMGWHDCGDSGIEWAISKRRCDEMMSDEVRKDSTFKRHGIRFQRLLLRSTGGLPVTYGHSLCSVL